MSELRAPDPTLDGLHEPVSVDYWSPNPGVAHGLPNGPGDMMTACGIRAVDAMPSSYAAYVAVPCRECFPDAPPLGFKPAVGCKCEWHSGGDGLAWQVQP